MSQRRLFRELSHFDSGLKKERQEIAGVLGIPLGGEKVVEVANRNSYVYVRLRESQNEVIQAFNEEVAPVYDLPVIVTRDGNRYKVVGRDTQRYENWGSYSAYLPRHGNSHSRNPHVSSGGDVVWVYSSQFMPLLGQPSGTAGSPFIMVNENLYLKSDGTWRYDDIQASSSLLVSKPTDNQARMLLVYMDTADGTLGYLTGTPFSATLTGTADIAQYIPSLTNTAYEPIVAVRLLSGTSRIKWDNLYDARQWFGRGGGSSFTGTTVGVYDEGALQGQVTSFDFVGPNVDVTVSGTRARVFVTGSVGGGGGNLTIEDVTSQINGTATHFNLAGTIDTETESLYYNGLRQRRTDHYTVDMDGGGFTTVFTGTVGDNLIIEYGNVSVVAGGGGIVVQDEGAFVATGTVLNFVGAGVTAALNGSVIDVTIPGGGGGGRTLITGAYPSGIDTVSLTSIPQTYNKLEIEMMGRAASVAAGVTNVFLNINGDTTDSNYYHEEFYGYVNGGIQFFSNGDNFSRTFGFIPGKNSPTGSFGWLRIEIPFYDKGTFFKIGQWHFALDAVDGSSVPLNMFQGQGSTVWRNKNPITALAVKSSDGNFMTGTVINFYGVS